MTDFSVAGSTSTSKSSVYTQRDHASDRPWTDGRGEVIDATTLGKGEDETSCKAVLRTDMTK